MASTPKPENASELGEVQRLTEGFSSPAPPHHYANLGCVTARRANGRAGWWKSPCPDPERASVGKLAEATRPVFMRHRRALVAAERWTFCFRVRSAADQKVSRARFLV